VHLVGPPLEVALDASGAGGRGRWVRSGYWPNAEVRAYACEGADAGSASVRGGSSNDHTKGTVRARRRCARTAARTTRRRRRISRALKQGEEIVVGWEWDDASALHRVAEVTGLDVYVCLIFYFFSSFVLRLHIFVYLPRQSFALIPSVLSMTAEQHEIQPIIQPEVGYI
jgi:hypothetical protein